LAIAVGGIIKDVIDTIYQAPVGYDVVYLIEMGLLLMTVFTMVPLIRKNPSLVQA